MGVRFQGGGGLKILQSAKSCFLKNRSSHVIDKCDGLIIGINDPVSNFDNLKHLSFGIGFFFDVAKLGEIEISGDLKDIVKKTCEAHAGHGKMIAILTEVSFYKIISSGLENPFMST